MVGRKSRKKKYTKNGEVASNIGITRVVTREINYLQKLKENEEKYRLIFENNQSGLFISELETGKIVECNQSFAKILGYNKNELINNFFPINCILTGMTEKITFKNY